MLEPPGRVMKDCILRTGEIRSNQRLQVSHFGVEVYIKNHTCILCDCHLATNPF